MLWWMQELRLQTHMPMLLFNRHLLSPLLQCIGHTLQHASPTPLRFGLCASPLGHVGLPAPSYVAATRTQRRTPPSSSGCRLLIEQQPAAADIRC